MRGHCAGALVADSSKSTDVTAPTTAAAAVSGLKLGCFHGQLKQVRGSLHPSSNEGLPQAPRPAQSGNYIGGQLRVIC